MVKLEDLKEGANVKGILPQQAVTVVDVKWLGETAVELVYKRPDGQTGNQLLYHSDEPRLEIVDTGQPIYKTGEGYPYITANYAPLTYLLALSLTPFVGMTYTAGRLWTLLAVLAAVLIIVAWVRRESKLWLPAIAAGLLFVGSPYVYHWAPLFRIDLIGLALTLAGLYVIFVAYPPRTKSQRAGEGKDRTKAGPFWLAVVLFVAALYAKQSFLFAPAAALLYLFLFTNRWLAVKMAAAIVVLGGGLFLVINSLTSGGFWYSLVASNVNPFLWPEFWKQQANFFGTFAVLGLLAVWYVVDKYLLDRTTPIGQKVTPLDFYLPAALASLFLAGKAGAWENYFFEALAAFALCGGLGLARLARHGRGLYALAAPLLVLAQVVLMWHSPQVAKGYIELTQASNEKMEPILAAMDDPIISEDVGLLVTNDKVVDYWAFQNSQLARAGQWDQAWELGQLRDRNLSLVILERGTRLDVDRYQRFTRQFLSELDRNYRHSQTVGKYELYEPDPLQYERRVEFGEDLALVGWSTHALPDLEPGETISLTVVWQAQQATETNYATFAHVVDQNGKGWAGDDHQPYDGLYPTSAWGPGEMVRDSFTLTVPADAPPGLYDLRVGVYDPSSLERLQSSEGDTVRVAILPVAWGAPENQTFEPHGARFGGMVTLAGYDWRIDPLGLRVVLQWSSDDYLTTDYTVFVHLVDPMAGDRLLAQSDTPPLEGRWPTSLWIPGAMVNDEHTVQLPPDLPPGTYDLLIGLYDPKTGVRLSLAEGADAVRLAGIILP